MGKELIKSLFILLSGMWLGAVIFARLSHDNMHGLADNAFGRDTTTVYDTIQVDKPVPRDSVVIRYVTQIVPAEREEPEPAPVITAAATSEDSVRVSVPITQKVYENDEYRAYVSGYQPSLDSLLFYRPTQVIRIKEKPKRWGIGVQVGYGFTPQGAQPYIGVGVSYSLFRF